MGEINRFAVQFFRTFVKIYQAQMRASSCETLSGDSGGAPIGNIESDALTEEASEHHKKGASTSARYGIIAGFKDAVLRRFQQFQFGFGRLEMAVDRLVKSFCNHLMEALWLWLRLLLSYYGYHNI